jgi:hypothetical protein
MSMRLSKLAALTPLALLGTACIPPDRAITSNYGVAREGQAVLIGYLRSTTELTLYSDAVDAKAHRYNNCINGFVENMHPTNTLLYDNKLVEVRGRLDNHFVSDNPLETMITPIKNNCNLPKVFVATQIRLLKK